MHYFKFYTDDDRNVDCVIHSRLYASAVGCFNDPFEGCVGYDIESMKSRAGEIMARCRQRTGVACLSQAADAHFVGTQLVMWAHYANSHKGFCVEFNEHLLDRLTHNARENGYVQVEYRDVMPVVGERNVQDDEDRWFIEAIGHKSSAWASESEIRLLSRRLSSELGTFIDVPTEAFTAIYVGQYASCTLCTRLIEAARSLGISCYKMEPAASAYELIPRLITNNQNN